MLAPQSPRDCSQLHQVIAGGTPTDGTVTAVNAWLCAPSLLPGANGVIRALMIDPMEARMWSHRFERLVTAALVVAAVLAFAVPIVLTLISPFAGR